ncbi:MAG TPA: sigma factor-like helix-turn-helix DNA-binding protein [Solirubrobacteraceae bacterium]|nr:sigma factor-like helix-turn-helix DNA-binding protein [Solirubrobacteraceae bacterium]
MSSLDSLPADQRAVLQLVLGRGRSYDEIGTMLSIDSAAVRERARGALDDLGPDSELDVTRRGAITDYLLGQLSPEEAGEVRRRLAEHPDERAWARIVAGELAPLGADRLPEIPAAAGASASAAAASPDPAPGPDGREAQTSGAGGSAPGGRSSRRGGALLLGGGLLLIIAIILIVALSGGGKSHKRPTASTPPSTATTSTSTTSSANASGAAKPIAQVNLTSPSGAKTPGGAAVVVRQGAQTGLVIRAVGVPANTKHDAYAVWLSTPGGASQILGFVNPAVAQTGILQTAGVLPATASRFTQLLVTLETQPKPTTPGKIVLQGALKLSG